MQQSLSGNLSCFVLGNKCRVAQVNPYKYILYPCWLLVGAPQRGASFTPKIVKGSSLGRAWRSSPVKHIQVYNMRYCILRIRYSITKLCKICIYIYIYSCCTCRHAQQEALFELQERFGGQHMHGNCVERFRLA